MVNPIGKIGGAERVLLSVLTSLRDRFVDLQATVITLTDGPLLEESERLGADSVCLEASDALNTIGESRHALAALARAGFAAPRALGLAGRLRKLIDSRQADIVHSFGLKTHLLLALRPPHRATVVWQVQDYYSRRTLSRLLCGPASRTAACVIGDSESVARDTRALVKSDKVIAIDNAVDTQRYTPDGKCADLDSAGGRAGVSTGVLKIGLVAAYARWKGQPTFLEAARRVIESTDAEVRFYVIGGPIYSTSGQFTREELEQLADRLGIRNRVCFVPFQADTAPVFRALDVVVHASTDPEPFGLVVTEALACGRPTIVAGAGGAADIITDGVDALTHKPGDAQDLAAKILALVEDPALRARLGAQGLETARRSYGLDRYADQVEAVYRRLASRGR
ncbi:MAG: glycosyltransferase family 4 protein [Planctomycetota bacterium]